MNKIYLNLDDENQNLDDLFEDFTEEDMNFDFEEAIDPYMKTKTMWKDEDISPYDSIEPKKEKKEQPVMKTDLFPGEEIIDDCSYETDMYDNGNIDVQCANTCMTETTQPNEPNLPDCNQIPKLYSYEKKSYNENETGKSFEYIKIVKEYQ